MDKRHCPAAMYDGLSWTQKIVISDHQGHKMSFTVVRSDVGEGKRTKTLSLETT